MQDIERVGSCGRAASGEVSDVDRGEASQPADPCTTTTCCARDAFPAASWRSETPKERNIVKDSRPALLASAESLLWDAMRLTRHQCCL